MTVHSIAGSDWRTCSRTTFTCLNKLRPRNCKKATCQDALSRYEKLIRLSKDATKRTQFRIAATQVRIQRGDSDRALTDLEGILADLKPDGWLYRDVQRKIEDVYLKQNDQSGLVTYYENRLSKFPDDLESMVRTCQVFSIVLAEPMKRTTWMKKAIEQAPSRIDLRRLFIDQLLADQQIAAAIEQYRQLSELDPKNNDILREWGKLVLRDPSRTSDESKAEASTIWQRILSSRSEEALTHIQVADLFQFAQMPAEAQKLFERAIELEPDEAQYREYYGDFLFKQDRVDDAFLVWDAIAEGARRNAASVMRLAEVYHHAKQNHKAAKTCKRSMRSCTQ